MNPHTGLIDFDDGHKEFPEGGIVSGVNTYLAHKHMHKLQQEGGPGVEPLDSGEQEDKDKMMDALKKESAKF